MHFHPILLLFCFPVWLVAFALNYFPHLHCHRLSGRELPFVVAYHLLDTPVEFDHLLVVSPALLSIPGSYDEGHLEENPLRLSHEDVLEELLVVADELHIGLLLFVGPPASQMPWILPGLIFLKRSTVVIFNFPERNAL